MPRSSLFVTSTLMVLAGQLATPSELRASRPELEARELSLSCDTYVDAAVDLYPFQVTTVGVDCSLRLFVARDGAPLPGLPPDAFRLNHFASQQCGSTFDLPADVWNLGYGVYSVQLPCEPEDMSLVVAVARSRGKSRGKGGPRVSAVVTWSRDSYARAGLIGHSQHAQSELEAIRAELGGGGDGDCVAALQPTLDSIQLAVNENGADLDSIQLLLTSLDSVVHSILGVVSSVLGKVNDILGALP